MKKTKYTEFKKTSNFKSKILHYFNNTIDQHATIIEYKDGEYLQEQQHQTEYLQLILQGKAKILKTEANGKRSIIQFISENDFVGDLTFVYAEQETKDVIAIGPTLTYTIPMDKAKEYLYGDIQFMQKMSQYIAKKLLVRMDHFSMNQSYELKYRLAHVILFTSIDGIYKENQSELAQYLGVSYRHLLHTMRFFKENDYLNKESNEYKINNKKLSKLITDFENK